MCDVDGGGVAAVNKVGYKMNLNENWWVLVPSVPSVTDAYGYGR